MANEKQDEATSLYISFLASMVIAQIRCTTALLIAMILDDYFTVLVFQFLAPVFPHGGGGLPHWELLLVH